MIESPAFVRIVRLLLRLAGAQQGNVLAIVALGLPALLLLIGGGIDMSRSYMARTSLQNACDAGVLAGRRAMSKSGSFGTAETALPLLVSLSMGGLELASFALANLRINQIAIAVADNASRAKLTSISGAAQFREYDVGETFRAADLAYPGMTIFTNGRIVLSSFETNTSVGQWIHWQRCRGSKAVGSKYGTQGTGSTGTSFAGMGPAGSIITAESGSAIMFVEVYYDYKPVVLPGATITIYRHAALYVRDDRDLSQIYNPSPTATVYSC